MVDGNADGAGVAWCNVDRLELLESEAAAGADLAVVADCGATHYRTQQVQGPWGDLGSLFRPGRATAGLLAWLVEVCLHTTLPILAEVVLLDGIIVAASHLVSGSIHRCAGDRLSVLLPLGLEPCMT